MASKFEIEAARAVLDAIAPSPSVEASRARAQLILEAAERVRARQAAYDHDEAMGRTPI